MWFIDITEFYSSFSANGCCSTRDIPTDVAKNTVSFAIQRVAYLIGFISDKTAKAPSKIPEEHLIHALQTFFVVLQLLFVLFRFIFISKNVK